jgi:DNA-binding FadR family transcriptional regulator
VDWHIGVATASHNELLGAFMTALSRAIYTATENEGFVDDEVRRLAGKAHRGITEAIRKRDEAAAVRRMRRHVHGYAEAVLKIDQREAITVPDEG